MSLDPYRVLRVSPDAEDSVIAAAYRALARRYHPDLAGDASARSMIEINAAWEILRDPARRRAYDRQRSQNMPTGPAGAPAAPVYHPGAESYGPTRDAPHHEHPPAGRATAHPGPLPGGVGAAGPPPGRPFGSVLDFGRHIGWSIGEIARVDPGYLEWLEEKPQGRPYLGEIDRILRQIGYRPSEEPVPARKGWFSRR
jgi:curved DNA-binding protein CbpA